MEQAEIRDPNPRNPKEARNPKSEMGGWRWGKRVKRRAGATVGVSGFGLRISFGFRISDFGFRVQNSTPNACQKLRRFLRVF
jgi:hypothetical protein